jgi:hypothetical protein
MRELLELSFTPANLLPTIFLVLVMVYWLVFLVGLLDLHFLDFHLDHDLHADAGPHADAAPHHGNAGKDISKDFPSGGHGFGYQLLDFFNLGHVPFMVFFSFFALFYWAGSILGNYYWAQGATMLTLVVLVGGFFLAALLTKAITQPLRKLFKNFNDDEKDIQFQGAICVIEISPVGNQMGQAVLRHQTKSISINVRSDSGNKIIHGTECVILERMPDQDCFLVAPLDAEPILPNTP